MTETQLVKYVSHLAIFLQNCWNGFGANPIKLIVLIAFGLASNISLSADDIATKSSWSALVKAISPYASVKYQHDSNLFRLPDEIPPADGRSDQYSTITGGIDSAFKYSQQELVLKGYMYRNSYNTYDYLDYTGGNGLAQWNWSGGKKLDGTLGYKYDRRMRGFENQIIPNPLKNLKTEKTVFASMDFKLLRNWVLNLRGSLAEIDFTTSELLNLDRNAAGGSIDYVSRSGNQFGFDIEITSGSYNNDSLKNYNKLEIGPTFDWKMTEKTKLRGQLGYSRRENDDINRIDYDGFTADVTLVRKGAKGDKLTAKAWRKLSNLNDEIANFAIVQGVSIEPRWQLSSKIAFGFKMGYEYRDFQGAGLIPPPPGVGSRDDNVYTGNISVDWKLNNIFDLSLGLDAEKRSSNREFRDYDDRIVYAQFSAEF
ncbi:MAG: outer membrane beta-barrel protein [Gammaproteobacteria bacterium]|nr:outer membrane beta-barrel protein [Gammaproteobacteria bacterium]MCP4089840.1 outer membrane beta-barrel protein [Gammaproteobacteria bacterium]MCP4275495.1 outer membrane beta-barrel protein [Gammaproteobacteria bacterium]MCP4832987.1 outer membrane beta-barrel protein [Gammaproteobacteria bacterium]MCP4928641.1 outer membrane beta-barrel protein [Gammaproteobacteria bacterium]